MHSAYELYEDLKTAQKHLILTDYLHLMYLMTPYNLLNQIQPIGTVYYDAVSKVYYTQYYQCLFFLNGETQNLFVDNKIIRGSNGNCKTYRNK